MTIKFITGNKNKFKELKEIIPTLVQESIDLPEIQDIDPKNVIKAKLLEASKRTKGEIIVEDTSLYLDCLKGLPGPLIKWFLATIKEEGLYKEATLHKNYKATAQTVIGYYKNGKIKFFEGKINGTIVKPRGNNGFYWDKIFVPEGYKKTFAEMSLKEKNKISHRRKASEKLKQYLIKPKTKEKHQ